MMHRRIRKELSRVVLGRREIVSQGRSLHMWVEAATNGRNDFRNSRVNTALLVAFAMSGPAFPIDIEMLSAVNVIKLRDCASHAVRMSLRESPLLIACRQCSGTCQLEL